MPGPSPNPVPPGSLVQATSPAPGQKPKVSLWPPMFGTVGFVPTPSSPWQTRHGPASSRPRAASAAAAGHGKADLIERLDHAEAGLAGALGKFSLVVEAYPELKADKQIASLSEELGSTENRISFSRQAFNDAVNQYNDAIGQFPANFVAGAFGFETAGHLRSTRSERERQPVAVNLT